MEKYDYLKQSNILVDESFKSITVTIDSTNYCLKENCDELLKKNEDLFDSVIEMMKSLRYKTSCFISNYANHSKKSYENMKNNLAIIKDTCRESLDELKEKLIIANITCCEETFLEFDGKYKSLKEEEKRIETEKANYQGLLDYFKTLSNSVNNLYHDMRSYVEKKNQDFNLALNSSNYEDKLVTEISQIQLDNIQNKILENVQDGYFKSSKAEKSIIQNKSKFNDSSNIRNLSNSNFNESSIDGTNNYANADENPNDYRTLFNNTKPITSIFNSFNNKFDNQNLYKNQNNKRRNNLSCFPLQNQNEEFLSNQVNQAANLVQNRLFTNNASNYDNITENNHKNIFPGSSEKSLSILNQISPINRTNKTFNFPMNNLK